MASVTGTAAFPVRYEYGTVSDGGAQRAFTKEIKLDSGGSDTAEYLTNFVDAAGRLYKTGFAGSTGPYRQSWFNNKGQLWKDRDPDGVVTLYTNNARGELAYACTDSNRNDVIDFSGQDRITRTTNEVVASHDTNVLRTTTYLWLMDSSSSGTLVSSVERSVEGFKTWQTNAGVLVNSSVKTLPSAGSWTVTQTAPDSSYSIALYQNGRLTSVTRYDSGSSQVGKTSYGYDAHGRRSTVTDARTGTTTHTFNNADQIVSVTTPPPDTGAAAQTTTTYFDAMGRATNIVQPDGTAKITEYFLTGLAKKKYGSRDYPVEYTYDPQGRLKTQTTWTNFAASGGAAVTTWYYHPERGWLTNKAYADGQGTKYSYTGAGRLATRLWARGTNTSYAYNNFGDLSSVTYNDAATPSVTETYTRRGQLGKVVRDGITTTLFYTTAGSLLSEHHSGGTLNGLRVTNTFDAQLRRTQVATKNGASALNATDYTYDTASRLGAVSDGTQSATYSYIANSPLIGQITFKQNTTTRMTTTKQYDYLNRLLSVSSAPSASSALSFVYSHNDANQRVRVNLADGSYWSYEYDALGQVKSGKRYWSDGTPVAGQQFEYGFDDIGNRRTTKAGGDVNGAGLRSASYTLNNLNQTTQRTVPGAVDIIGAATATATNVNVNNVMAYRRGEYHRVELSIDNSTVAQWQSVTNRAVQNGTTNSVTGNVFLPQTPEVLSHDADGNLTNDGHWAYTWDGENRLTRLIAHSSTPTGARQTLLFSNDWQGRRISKVVSNWTGSSWSKTSESKSLYDGWNLVAILDSANTLLYSFRWGTDLSGTLQGAGGVGGLISMTVHTGGNAGTYFYAFDGNGNVVGLINAADGSTAARYEYGPFGELNRASGALAFLNPFRFSTKFQDDETGFLYYGYRYYDPSTGRWLSRDPIGEKGGRNLFAFVENNLNLVDGLGETPTDGSSTSEEWFSICEAIGASTYIRCRWGIIEYENLHCCCYECTPLNYPWITWYKQMAPIFGACPKVTFHIPGISDIGNCGEKPKDERCRGRCLKLPLPRFERLDKFPPEP